MRSRHIEALRAEHLPQAVDVHLRAFPSFFLSSLGPRFLREFYASFVVDPAGIGFAACGDDGSVLGVVVGPMDPRGYFRRLLRRRWWAFTAASLGAIMRNPRCVPRIARAVHYRGEPPSGFARALLSSIAVDPRAQRQGVGEALLEAWVGEVCRRGAMGCFLTTDADHNQAVNHFYMRMDWVLESTYLTPEHRRMNRYVFDFTASKGGRYHQLNA